MLILIISRDLENREEMGMTGWNSQAFAPIPVSHPPCGRVAFPRSDEYVVPQGRLLSKTGALFPPVSLPNIYRIVRPALLTRRASFVGILTYTPLGIRPHFQPACDSEVKPNILYVV